MTALGIFDASNEIHLECIRFCFWPILQIELHDAVVLWNNHYIGATTKNGECIPGRPDVLYYTPATSGGRDCKLFLTAPMRQLHILWGIKLFPINPKCFAL